MFFSSKLQLCFVQSQTCLNKSFIALYSFQQLQYRVAGAGSTKSRNHKSRSHKSFSFQSQVVRAETFLTYAVQGSSQRLIYEPSLETRRHSIRSFCTYLIYKQSSWYQSLFVKVELNYWVLGKITEGLICINSI